jgi:isoquinoline 1-oxidoreductase beta subunit
MNALNRRSFLKTGATLGGGLLVSFQFPQRARAQAAAIARLNGYVHISADDVVTLLIGKGEMGQGTITSLAQILAEELECDWKRIKWQFTPVDAKLYGPMQGVFGSLSVRTMYAPLRQAGAQAKEMLMEAAAKQWGVSKAQTRAENGVIVNTATNARAAYGSLADAAAKITPPSSPALKDPKQFKLIGSGVKRIDTPSKVNGTAQFGLDTRQPGMVYAVVQRCPVFGGKVKSFDATKAKAVEGVKEVIQISSGVAVIADNTWNAMEGRKALTVVWDEGPAAALSTPGLTQMFASSMQKDGAVARKVGDAPGVIAKASKKIEAVYEVPFLSHAPMEPMNATALVKNGKCDVWAPTQMQTGAHEVAVQTSGLKPEDVTLHTTFMGGGFGRRGGPDFVGDAVEISKALGVPVKVTWAREDDMQHDLYRPASYVRFQGALDADGWPAAITSRVACPPFGPERDGVAGVAVEGIHDMRYAVPNLLVDYHRFDVGIPVSYWRSVGYSQNCYFTESFIDELAAEGKKDPLEFRRKLLAGTPRLLAALNLAAEKFGWDKPLPAGHGKGIGVVNNIGSFTAQIAEVSVSGGKLKVHRVVAAIDCGQVVNPPIIEAQIQSGIVYGLASMKAAITIDKGRVQQGNFHQYEVTRIDEMPVVEVHIVPSTAAPGGTGEASTPGIVPAIANAIYSATGKRIRKLPIRAQDLA